MSAIATRRRPLSTTKDSPDRPIFNSAMKRETLSSETSTAITPINPLSGSMTGRLPVTAGTPRSWRTTADPK